MLRKDFDPRYDEFQPVAVQLGQFEDKLNEQASTEAAQVYQSARMTMLVLGVLAVLIAVGAALLVTRSLLSQLGGEPSYVASVMQSLGGGDFKHRGRDQGRRPVAACCTPSKTWSRSCRGDHRRGQFGGRCTRRRR